MLAKQFTVSVSPVTIGSDNYRITKIVGQGVTFYAANGDEYQIGDTISKSTANHLGPTVKLTVTR